MTAFSGHTGRPLHASQIKQAPAWDPVRTKGQSRSGSQKYGVSNQASAAARSVDMLFAAAMDCTTASGMP